MSFRQSRTQILLLSDLLPRGDGTYSLRPKPSIEPDLDAWVPVSSAAKLLNVSRSCVHNWLGSYLVYRRPCPGKILISMESIESLKRLRHDPEFWASPAAKSARLKAVLQSMCKLIAGAPQ